MRAAPIAILLFALAFSAVSLGCTDDGGNGTGGAGTTGSAGSTGGAGTTGSAGATGSGGSSANFRAVAPCNTESVYSGGNAVNFGGATSAVYTPQCLKINAGTAVAFAGDFFIHPLSPSTMRGDLSGNPITHVASGTSQSFTFASPGYFAYYCEEHGPSDGAAGMVGVVWVQ